MSISDFLRLIAGGLLALVSSYIGLLVKRGYGDNAKLYKDMVDFCDTFKNQLTFQKTVVIDFCKKFIQGKNGAIVSILEEYTKELTEKGQFTCDAENWEVAHLKTKEKQEIADFLSGLGKSPTVEQVQFVEKSEEIFKLRKKEAEENEKKKGNMFFKLFVLLGIALMIILG